MQTRRGGEAKSVVESDSQFAALPKVELHVHLDCCVSYDAARVLKPGLSEGDYRNQFVAPPRCLDLEDLLSSIAHALKVMQTQEQLRIVAEDLFRQFEADRVVYAEIRFAPFLHTDRGLPAGRVVEIVERSVSDLTRATGIEASVILCALRHYREDESLAVAQLVADFRGSRVVALDLSADEARFPVDPHISAYRQARELGLHRTAHAGEARGPESVWQAVKHLQPTRIGHGVRSIEDRDLVSFLAQHQIHLEVCPSCNVQIGIFPSMAQHAIDALFKAGVSVGINTDGRALCDTSLTREYQRLHAAFGYGEDEFRAFNRNALRAAFIDRERRVRLERRLG